jgi:hypothetical protein
MPLAIDRCAAVARLSRPLVAAKQPPILPHSSAMGRAHTARVM